MTSSGDKKSDSSDCELSYALDYPFIKYTQFNKISDWNKQMQPTQINCQVRQRQWVWFGSSDTQFLVLVLFVKRKLRGAVAETYVFDRTYMFSPHGQRRCKGLHPHCKRQSLSLDTLLALPLESLLVVYAAPLASFAWLSAWLLSAAVMCLTISDVGYFCWRCCG